MLRTTVSLTGILLAGAIFFFYTQPEYDKTKDINAQIAEYNQALQKAAELQQLKQQLLDKYNKFDPNDIDRLQKLLPDHVDNIRLILDIDNLAQSHQMQLSNVQVNGNDSNATQQSVIGTLGTQAQKYDSLQLGFTTSGTYDDFKSILSDLEKSLRIVDLVSLSIAPAGTVQGPSGLQPTYTYMINLKTYWLK
jgi:Tfp pilus assembly protein PilO